MVCFFFFFLYGKGTQCIWQCRGRSYSLPANTRRVSYTVLCNMHATCLITSRVRQAYYPIDLIHVYISLHRQIVNDQTFSSTAVT
ncbi:hypothetical protein PSV08DRAFT_286386 [Bipolaris maydis]|uniref:uncharacterized protein n=1 Tax=Cochliobolus heterostrophus TaxID=5016 RepID=UPI0024DC0D71|nr:hypothetical protein J3E73DRAFT_353173 [Bipolaris maydis]KAJ6271933.1 hypothetical protein PSV08DRAFT_286386 [Bipolaris maydis]